jgi:hypothetical protein
MTFKGIDPLEFQKSMGRGYKEFSVCKNEPINAMQSHIDATTFATDVEMTKPKRHPLEPSGMTAGTKNKLQLLDLGADL